MTLRITTTTNFFYFLLFQPTIFGTVADRCPKDGVNRRVRSKSFSFVLYIELKFYLQGFPQTTQSNSNTATEFCSPDSDELGKDSDLDDNVRI